MEEVLDTGDALLAEIASLEVERAQIDAKIAGKMVQIQDMRRREADADPNPRRGQLIAASAADDLSLVTLLPVRTVQCRLAEFRRVRNLLPKAWAAFGAGMIDAYRIQLIGSAVANLSGDLPIIELDHRVVEYASTHTGTQLKGWLTRFVAKAEPELAEQRAKSEVDKRAVWIQHQGDGMSTLVAYLQTADAVKIDHRLNTGAKCAKSDGRSMDQMRADGLVDQMLSSTDGSTSSHAVIGILVPVTSLAGLTDEPGEAFDGSFALPASMVRELATEPGTLFYRVMTDPLGKILDITELGRFPSAKLHTAVEIRDGTCKFATCNRPAAECDKDHELPYPHGPTTGANLGSLCRRHHEMKTHLVFDPRRAAVHARTPSVMEHHLAVTIEYAG
jgi:hypothetical protein